MIPMPFALAVTLGALAALGVLALGLAEIVTHLTKGRSRR